MDRRKMGDSAANVALAALTNPPTAILFSVYPPGGSPLLSHPPKGAAPVAAAAKTHVLSAVNFVSFSAGAHRLKGKAFSAAALDGNKKKKEKTRTRHRWRRHRLILSMPILRSHQFNQ